MNTRLIKNEKIRKRIQEEKKTRRKEKNNKKMKKFFIILLALGIAFLLYARFIEPNFLLVNEKKITSTTIDKSFHGIKIVHFSDLHFGNTINKNNIEKIIKKINILKPDIIFFTGDLIEDEYDITNSEIQILTKSLSSIDATIGKYAIIGNHDYNQKNYKDIMYDANFIILNNNYDLAYYNSNNPIGIYGVDDYLLGSPNMDKYNEESFANTSYKILLIHEGDYISKIINEYKFDLILGGHSHNKQVNIPKLKTFWLPPGAKKYYEPYYKVNDTDIFISNGIGTSEVKLRFLSFPSINLYRINKVE